MSDSGRDLNRKDMERLLNEFAVRINKLDPNNDYTLYLVGGAAMVLYYDCRESSRDIDVSWRGNHKVIAKAIHDVADYNSINQSWINNDYEKSESFTRAILIVPFKDKCC